MPATLPTELVTLARHQDGVVSIAQARTALTADRLARAIAFGTLTRLWHGTYTVPELMVDRTRSLLSAADLTLGVEAVACHHTAAALHPQFWVKALTGQRFRLDLAWPEFRVACEYDGVAFHTGDRLFADRARLNALGRIGWTVLFATTSTLFGGRHALVADLRRRLC